MVTKSHYASGPIVADPESASGVIEYRLRLLIPRNSVPSYQISLKIRYPLGKIRHAAPIFSEKTYSITLEDFASQISEKNALCLSLCSPVCVAR